MVDIKKVIEMENILNKHGEIIEEFNRVLDKFKESQKDYRKLIAYYSSSEYMKDLEDSDLGKIDPNIKQGIYSQDLIYNLLGDNYQTAIKMLDIGLDIIKNN